MTEREVVIVGAGPVGLAAALAVRATGRHATVIEAGAADRVRPGSRAIFLHKVTLQLLDRIRPGTGTALVQEGLSWTTKRTMYRGTEVYARTYPAPADRTTPAATSLPQVVTERILLEACKAADVEFIWRSEVMSVSPSADGVVLSLLDDRRIRAAYVIGADGARSVVRESTNLRLEGPRTSNAFVIVDVAEDASSPLPLERVFHYEHPALGLRNVLFVPFAGHWRVDLQCHPGDDPDAFSSASGVRDWLVRVMPPKYAERVTWVSTYVFRQAVANAFTDGTRRVLLVGEAAHVFAPFGARGLNSGVADAAVSATAIDAALRASSRDDAERVILESADSRRVAALRNRAASSTALAHLEAATWWRRAVRRAAAQLAPRLPSAGRWLDKAPFGPPLGAADRYGMYY